MQQQFAGHDGATALIMRAKVLVFDFDGTLVDSNEIKWLGFESVFADFPEYREKITAYCRGFHHTVRDEKFRYVYETILGLPYTSEVAGALHKRYASVTTGAVIGAPEVSGASAFLRGISPHVVTAVLSSTPQDILLQILEERGWRSLFQRIQGAPVDKAAWLRDFRAKHGLASDELVFFGDTDEDREAACMAQCAFVGVANPALSACVVRWIEDFSGLIFEPNEPRS
jgi:phosphoglycolate phosphatase-like HAD superfamily hydrolase